MLFAVSCTVLYPVLGPVHCNPTQQPMIFLRFWFPVLVTVLAQVRLAFALGGNWIKQGFPKNFKKKVCSKQNSGISMSFWQKVSDSIGDYKMDNGCFWQKKLNFHLWKSPYIFFLMQERACFLPTLLMTVEWEPPPKWISLSYFRFRKKHVAVCTKCHFANNDKNTCRTIRNGLNAMGLFTLSRHSRKTPDQSNSLCFFELCLCY